jgi:alkanesulfonate monooxygenase SsuD/methylene tetrahydromethanopterin reductase-like flavin-dependent oxidoreductase (luciferase family)
MTPSPEHGLRFGVHSGQQNAAFGDCLALWRRAEELGYDWCSVFDHLRPPMGGPDGPCFEGTTLLSALAAHTSRVRCALLVSAVTWRHPAMLASIAATIDHVSGGRLELGIGAGGGDLAYQQYGLPWPAPQDRVDLLEETAQVLRGLWSGERFSFQGKHVRLADAYVRPAPVQRRLPLVIGGAGPRLLRVAAEHADVWNSLVAPPPVYRDRCEALLRHCEEIGRDPASIRRSMTFRALLVENETELPARLDRLRRHYPPDSPVWPEFLVFGTPEQCAAALGPYIELGVTDFILGARPPVDWTSLTLFAEQVVPRLRGRSG